MCIPLYKETLINSASFFRKYLHFQKAAEKTVALVSERKLLVFSVTNFKIDEIKNQNR